ncbi:hypothetical protein [Paraclostridium sp. AKS81]|uniref:hypothetical protein n=1 Tax=Paraclostridium sp. AKS81 TaxID=2876117 RepID=UPI0021E04462|nr:hypothetical protein [Paraclostridium sp. AKS81]MCU9811498.1 hypothetical protein [Paraclostridium sp. AKS81]
MDRARKKELLQQFKEMKPEMGVYMFKSINTNTVYLGCDKNIKATINGDRFKLNSKIIDVKNYKKIGMKIKKKNLK